MLKKIYKNRFFKITVIVTIALGLVFLGYKNIYETKASSNETMTVKEEKVTKGDITIGFTGDGQAEIPVVNLDFEISGKLKDLYVKEGDEIKKGQLLAKLDDTEYEKKVKTSEVNYNKTLASLEQRKENVKLTLINEKQKLNDLKAKLDQLKAEYQPMKSLESYYAKQEIEFKRINYENAKAAYETQLERYEILSNSNKDIEVEKKNVESAKINLELANNDLENTSLASPITATVLNISNKPGETISTPKDSSQITADTSHFIVVSDSNKVEVVVPVSELDLRKVRMNQIVEVTFEAYEGERLKGKVIGIKSLPNIDSSGIVTYDVKIELDEGLGKIKSGMTCSVNFILRQQKNTLIIPNKAVRVVEGKQVVKVKDEGGNIISKNIKTGLTDGKYVAVTEGLNVGETVLIENKKVE
ncbi:efflux RND transporter periplasmic adaptor subunit [Crassaminicella profunda]|uniref:efflux RND transporter periplasmic adaptor subunit n=1 Tax=Crassaminicella profunda TaxID=1286698 RepID=UPI001CA6E643|nr:efflux RND transporter periplasmic adaptor subunit [Crassaminicella profunda]QZY54898.1 efflux RND transporter periplasmic adaptor subunit [Crassaminicella profunda]